MKNVIFESYMEGLRPESYKVVEKYFDLVKADELSHELQHDIPVILRFIITLIIEPNEHGCNNISTISQNWRGITSEKVLELVDVNEIISLWKVYKIEFMPISKNYLPNLDSEAELTLLFGNNYIYKLIDKL